MKKRIQYKKNTEKLKKKKEQKQIIPFIYKLKIQRYLQKCIQEINSYHKKSQV
jgi:hypothetical protein